MNKILPDVSIVIISFNTCRYLEQIVSNIYEFTKEVKFELIIVDNNSTDKSVSFLKQLEKNKKNCTVIFNNNNIGFAKANNQAAKLANGKYLLFLNSDTKIESDVISGVLIKMKSNIKVGIGSCAIRNEDLSEQGTGGYFPNIYRVACWMLYLDDIPFLNKFIKPFHPWHKLLPSKDLKFSIDTGLDWLTGAFFLVKKDLFLTLQGFDEDYFMYVEDVDLCFRAKMKGYDCMLFPQNYIIHYGGKSSNSSYPLISEFLNLKIFYRKHYSILEYLILLLLLKVGALLRIIVLGLVKGPRYAKIYAEVFIHS